MLSFLYVFLRQFKLIKVELSVYICKKVEGCFSLPGGGVVVSVWLQNMKINKYHQTLPQVVTDPQRLSQVVTDHRRISQVIIDHQRLSQVIVAVKASPS